MHVRNYKLLVQDRKCEMTRGELVCEGMQSQED